MPKISELTEKLNLSPTDVLPIVDYSNTLSPVTKKATLAEVRGNIYVKTVFFEATSSQTGTVTLPANAEFIIDNWEDGVDLLVSELDSNGIPIFQTPTDTEGFYITASLTSLDITTTFGYQLSGTPTDTIGIIYPYKVIYWQFDYTKSIGDSLVFENVYTDLYNIISEPTGYLENHKPEFSYSYSAPTLTINVTNTTSHVFKGEIYTNIPFSHDISVTDGERYFVYYTDGNVITQSSSPWDLETTVPIFHVWWDSSTLMVIDYEAHGAVMDWKTHNYLHSTRGTQIKPGDFELSFYYDNQTVSTLSCTEGTVEDEDNYMNVINSTSTLNFHQELSPTLKIPIYYREGTKWNKTIPTTHNVISDGTNNFYNYNNAGSWEQATISESFYYASWICVSNDISNPIFAIQGQRQDQSLSNILGLSLWSDLILTDFKIAEYKVLYRIIHKYSSTYINDCSCVIIDVRDYRQDVVNSLQKISPIDQIYKLQRTTNYYPDTLSINASYSIIGTTSTIDTIKTIDDGEYIYIEEINVTDPMDFSCTITGVSTFNKVLIHAYYTGAGGTHYWRPFIWDYSLDTPTWSELAVIDGGLSGSGDYVGDVEGNFVLKVFDIVIPTKYIESGNVRLKLNHGDVVNTIHRAGVDYITLLQESVSGGVSDHSQLTGLTDLGHPASSIIATTHGNIVGTNVQAQLEELESEKVPTQDGLIYGQYDYMETFSVTTSSTITLNYSNGNSAYIDITGMTVSDTLTILSTNFPSTANSYAAMSLIILSSVSVPSITWPSGWTGLTPDASVTSEYVIRKIGTSDARLLLVEAY